ncbi:hypothetical protein Xcel_1374 [Xylanimonas cellulosilytica DSM 15894]|uniref:Uncharacterized protein n=1 Tax=Xylanimonas cellulosilytica (strain DSM 15894 / JCM 12276 / CECT 5975 / KCTC 9989 / LMG 20990 / NBRC 107835 / XIL07) TaxID=446471 RepID=D1BRF0_XYLCX|nr:hypothetical protein [Xylanimonas cellulosilytica]ACZ30405.1 hypothetical protein Xcel_1374 [Xylanimonas cellulosilytica DSM 15894]
MTTTPSEPRRIHIAFCLLVGMASAALGILPWTVHGMRLPLQNLWATTTLPDEMPLVLLPFNQYAIGLLFGLVVAGWAIAGVVVRWLRDRLAPGGTTAVGTGVAVVQAAATVPTALTVRAGLREGSDSAAYLAALLAVVIVAVLLGVLVLRLIARAARPGATVGLSLAAVPVGLWLSGFVTELGTGSFGVRVGADPVRFVVGIAPAVLVGVAIAWGGLRSRSQILAASASVLILWVAPAVVSAVSVVAGSRVLLGHPAEMVDVGLLSLRTTLTSVTASLLPVLIAVVVGGLGTALATVRAARDRRAE